MSNNVPLPDLGNPFVGVGGRITKAWSYWLQGFAASPAAFDSGPWGSSPLSYTASVDGSFLITGGTGVSVSLIRSGASVAGPVTGFIPMTKGDQIIVTWATLPAMSFIPG